MCSAQPQAELRPPPPLDPAEGERVARALVAELLSQKPDRDATSSGVLKIREPGGSQREVAVKFDIRTTGTNWLNVYEASATSNAPGAKLVIVHSEGRPNQYFLSGPAGPGTASSVAKELTGDELMVPFAGSDFWVADLGLEFLHWPQQRVLKKQMRKGLFCDVLQSINPQAGPGGYARVVSWIAANRPDEIIIVHAEAYDRQDKLLKEFAPKKVQKVNGAWQLEEMEIRNRQSGSRTRIEFNLEPK